MMAREKFRLPRPRGLSRWLARAPIELYRARLGWILGRRFLMLVHKGRRSGLLRRTVLEVVKFERNTGAYYVASGWGEKADWYRNVMADPQVEVFVGRDHFLATARRLEPEEAGVVLIDYARRHPLAMKELAGLLGYLYDGSEDDLRVLARQLPLLELRPRPS